MIVKEYRNIFGFLVRVLRKICSGLVLDHDLLFFKNIFKSNFFVRKLNLPKNLRYFHKLSLQTCYKSLKRKCVSIYGGDRVELMYHMVENILICLDFLFLFSNFIS